MLRDRLVCRVNHKGIQRKLLAEKDLTYDKAMTLATAIEAAERDSRNLRGTKQDPENVNYQTQGAKNSTSGGKRRTADPTKQQGTTVTCYRCGGPHLAPTRKFKETECLYCKKKGHLARVCRAKAKAKAVQQTYSLHERGR